MDNEILHRFLRCETSPSEEDAIAGWLEADPENRKTLDALQLTMEGLSLLPPEPAGMGLIVRAKPSLIVRIGRWTGAAAVVSVLVWAGSVYLADRKFDRYADAQTILRVPAGQQVQITLPDGSSVWLNSGSQIQYPVLFAAKRRRVSVEGEALFDVARDPKRPFVVETFACDVEVLGTSFDVTAQPEKKVFSTAVFRGRVQVTNRIASDERFVLEPDQEVRLDGTRLVTGTFRDREAYLWTGGIVSVRGLAFEELMRKFEKDFGVRITLACDPMPEIGFNYGKFRIADGIETALRLLQQRTDFAYTRDDSDGSIIITN